MPVNLSNNQDEICNPTIFIKGLVLVQINTDSGNITNGATEGKTLSVCRNYHYKFQVNIPTKSCYKNNCHTIRDWGGSYIDWSEVTGLTLRSLLNGNFTQKTLSAPRIMMLKTMTDLVT